VKQVYRCTHVEENARFAAPFWRHECDARFLEPKGLPEFDVGWQQASLLK